MMIFRAYLLNLYRSTTSRPVIHCFGRCVNINIKILISLYELISYVPPRVKVPVGHYLEVNKSVLPFVCLVAFEERIRVKRHNVIPLVAGRVLVSRVTAGIIISKISCCFAFFYPSVSVRPALCRVVYISYRSLLKGVASCVKIIY